MKARSTSTGRALLLAVGWGVAGTTPGRAQDSVYVADSVAVLDTVVADSAKPYHYRNKFLGLPFVGYGPTTKFIFGAGGSYQFKYGAGRTDSLTRGSSVGGGFSITTAGQWGVFFGLDLFTPTNRWWFKSRGEAGFAPIDFYGIGPSTEDGDRTQMDQRVVRFELKALRHLKGSFYLGPYYRLHSAWDVKFDDPSLVPAGLHGRTGSTSSGLGLSVVSDKRGSLLTPLSGHLVVLDALANHEVFGSDYDYGYVLADARLYLPVSRRKDVLALNAYGQFNGRNVPLQTMAQISNITTQVVMRGVYLGRFRDRHMLVAQADYRTPVWWRFGMVVFGAAGNVFGGTGTGLPDDMKYTGGAGIRFNINKQDPLNLRADLTFTSFGTTGFSFGLGEAF